MLCLLCHVMYIRNSIVDLISSIANVNMVEISALVGKGSGNLETRRLTECFSQYLVVGESEDGVIKDFSLSCGSLISGQLVVVRIRVKESQVIGIQICEIVVH